MALTSMGLEAFSFTWGQDQRQKGLELGDKCTAGGRSEYGKREVLAPCPTPLHSLNISPAEIL